MSNIKVTIWGEFKKQGFNQAQRSTSTLEKGFKKLGAQVLAAFSVSAITQFSKAAIKAFEEDEKAASQLTNAIKNAGLAFQSAEIRTFVKDLESSAMVMDDQLMPAMQRLIMLTGSFSRSQEILNTAIEVSRGTGVDLETVVADLSKAFQGQTRSLMKYNLGLTATQLKGKTFEQLLNRINDQYKGSNAAYLETYAGKTEALNIAYANMQETVGKGLVDAFIKLAGDEGIGGATKAIEAFGTAVADTISGAVYYVEDFQTKFAPLFKLIDFLDKFSLDLLEVLDIFERQGAEQRRQSEYWQLYSDTWQKKLETDAQLAAAEEAALKRQRLLNAEKKKAAKLAAQELANAKALKGAQRTFDMDRIQIEAALQGNISEVDRERLRLQRAILNENVDAIKHYQELLAEAEARLAALQQTSANLNVSVSAQSTTETPQVIISTPNTFQPEPTQIPISDTPVSGFVGNMGMLGTPVDTAVIAAIYDALPQITPYTPTQPPVVVNVTVQGSVVSENDLVAVVTEAAQTNDKYGIPFMYDRYAI